MVDLDNLRTRFCKNIQKTRRVWLILAFVLHVWREFWSKRPSFKNQCLPRWVCSTLLCMGKTEYQHAYRGMYRSFNAKLGWFLCWTYNTEIWKSSAVCVLVFGFPPTEQGITHLPRYASIFQHMAKTVNLDNFPAIIFGQKCENQLVFIRFTLIFDIRLQFLSIFREFSQLHTLKTSKHLLFFDATCYF